MSYIGYHGPETGDPIGPQYRVLIGDGLLHMENGETVSYIYPDYKHAIR